MLPASKCVLHTASAQNDAWPPLGRRTTKAGSRQCSARLGRRLSRIDERCHNGAKVRLGHAVAVGIVAVPGQGPTRLAAIGP